MIRRKNTNLALEYNHQSTNRPQIYFNNDSVLEYNHQSTDRPTKIYLSKTTAHQLNTTDCTRKVDESFQAIMDGEGYNNDNYQEFEVYAQRRDGKFFGAAVSNGEQYGHRPDDDDDHEEDDDGSDDDSDASDTEYLKLQSVPNGYIVNSDVYLTAEQWNCVMPHSDTHWYCALCDQYVETDLRTAHTSGEVHARNMVLSPPLKLSALSVTRKIYDKYHCGVCNVLLEEDTAMAHFETKEHEEKKLFAYNKASDITYDYKLDDGATNSYSRNENNHYVRNNHSANQNNNNQDADNRVVEYNPNDPNNGYNNINNDCDSGYNTGCQSPSMSYASMAKKAQAAALPTFLRVDLGNRVIEVRFDAWHMIVYSRGGLHCMACNVSAPRRTRAEHCRSPAHAQRLRQCAVLPHYGEYLVRQVDDHLYHCGHCNNLKLIHDMVDHIADNHPTITKVIKRIPPRNTTNPTDTAENTSDNTTNAVEIPSCNNTEVTNTAREIQSLNNTEKEMQSKSENIQNPRNFWPVEKMIPKSASNDNNDTFNTAVGPNTSAKINTEKEIQTKNNNDVVWSRNVNNTGLGETASLDSRNLFDVPSVVKSLTGSNFFSTRQAKIGINGSKTGVENTNTLNSGILTVSELEDNINSVKSDNTQFPQKAANDITVQNNRNAPHIERTENNKAIFLNGVPNIELKSPDNYPAFINSLKKPTEMAHKNIPPFPIPTQTVRLSPIPTQTVRLSPIPTQTVRLSPIPTQNMQLSPIPTQSAPVSPILTQHIPLTPAQTQNLPQFDTNTPISMFIFGHNVTINLLAMNTIMQLGAVFTCSLCDVKLSTAGLVDHILNDTTHKERLDGTPFIPEFLCHLIRPIRCNFLHCAICNMLVPYDKKYVHTHIDTPYHAQLLRRSAPEFTAHPPTDVATVSNEASDSDAEDPDADPELTEYTLAKLKKIYIKIETVAWHSLVRKGDGDMYCFVCSLALAPDWVPTHVRTKRHGRNLQQCKILGNNYGTNLFRQILDTFHCLNCNIITTKNNIPRHLDWPPHTHNTHTSFERDGDMPVKEILTQKQTNSKQSRGHVTIEYDVLVDKSCAGAAGAPDEQAAPNLHKIIRCGGQAGKGGQVLKIKWENWHGVAAFKDGYRCKLCQTEIRKSDLAAHVKQAIHVDYVQNEFSHEYKDALFRIISESRLHCLICNVELCLTENVAAHVVGKRHTKHREQVLEESSRANAFADCDTRNIVFI